jgi:peptidoglycan/LPS O-acetylase OafA/YrhL
MNARNRIESVQGNRVAFLDNVRTFVVFLVVLCHAGWVYESSGIGASFWIVDDAATNDASGLVNIVLDIFMMPTLFFVSGFFARPSVETKTGRAFLTSRLKRLVIPWAIAALTLIPLYKAIFLYSRNLPQGNWTTYFHWSNGIWGQNWLWFLPVLFLFNVLYLALSRAKIKMPRISVRVGVLGAFVIGFVCSFTMDVRGLQGWTKTAVLDFQNERLLIYFMMFLLGALCHQRKVFDARPRDWVLYIIVNSTAWIPVTAYIFFLLYPWLKPGQFIISEIGHKLILWFSFHLSLLCLVYLTIETFWRYLDKPGKLRKELNENSYSVYIIHVVVIGGLASIMLNVAIPSLMKYLILTASAFVMSNAAVSLCRRLSIRYACRPIRAGI